MVIYSDEIDAKLTDLKDRRQFCESNGVGKSVNFECGCFVRVEIRERSGVFEEIGFSSNGCGYMIAAAAGIAAFLKGSEITSLGGCPGEVFRKYLEHCLDPKEVSRPKCLAAASEAYVAALANHRNQIIDEQGGEQLIVCTCFGVSEDRLIEVIKSLPRPDVGSIAEGCNAGRGCGSCSLVIQELIDQYLRGVLVDELRN